MQLMAGADNKTQLIQPRNHGLKWSFVPARVTFMQGQNFNLFYCIIFNENSMNKKTRTEYA